MSPQLKNKILFACLLALTIGNMMINNVIAVMPNFIEKQRWVSQDGKKLNENDISLILAIFSVAQIIFAPFNGAIKGYLGSKNTIIFGFVLMTITTAGLGMIAHVKDPYTFLYIACVLRFF